MVYNERHFSKFPHSGDIIGFYQSRYGRVGIRSNGVYTSNQSISTSPRLKQMSRSRVDEIRRKSSVSFSALDIDMAIDRNLSSNYGSKQLLAEYRRVHC